MHGLRNVRAERRRTGLDQPAQQRACHRPGLRTADRTDRRRWKLIEFARVKERLPSRSLTSFCAWPLGHP